MPRQSSPAPISGSGTDDSPERASSELEKQGWASGEGLMVWWRRVSLGSAEEVNGLGQQSLSKGRKLLMVEILNKCIMQMPSASQQNVLKVLIKSSASRQNVRVRLEAPRKEMSI